VTSGDTARGSRPSSDDEVGRRAVGSNVVTVVIERARAVQPVELVLASRLAGKLGVPLRDVARRSRVVGSLADDSGAPIDNITGWENHPRTLTHLRERRTA